jgi:hypothetical protein
VPTEKFFLGLGKSTNQFYNDSVNQINDRLEKESVEAEFQANMGQPLKARLSLPGWPSTWRSFNTNTTFLGAQLNSENGLCDSITNLTASPAEIAKLQDRIAKQTYKFSSERQVQPSHPHHRDAELTPNASNLAYCLNDLQTNNKDLFDLLNKLMHRIFPTIYWISAPPGANNMFELKVHTTRPELR